MKVDVTTLDGDKMAAQHATQPVGSSLRIAPAFIATALDEAANVETTIEAHYVADRGRYLVTTIVNRATAPDFDEDRLKRTQPLAILRAAVPHCITLQLDDDPDTPWTTVADLNSTEGRIIPTWLAEAVVKWGVKDPRWEVIEILYGTATLAELPPLKLISLELDVPERTATSWIREARAAGWLAGITSNIGRRAND